MFSRVFFYCIHSILKIYMWYLDLLFYILNMFKPFLSKHGRGWGICIDTKVLGNTKTMCCSKYDHKSTVASLQSRSSYMCESRHLFCVRDKTFSFACMHGCPCVTMFTCEFKSSTQWKCARLLSTWNCNEWSYMMIIIFQALSFDVCKCDSTPSQT